MPNATPEVPTPTHASADPAPGRRMPFGVKMLAILQALRVLNYAGLLVFFVIDPDNAGDLYAALRDRVPLFELLPDDTAGPLLITLVTAFALATLASLVLLVRLSRAGWTITMLLTGISLLFSLIVWWGGYGIQPLAWIIDIVATLYLNQREVRRAFGIGASSLGAMLEPGR